MLVLAQDGPSPEQAADAAGRGVVMLLLLALLGVLLVTAVALVLALRPNPHRDRRRGRHHPENDAWAAAASRVSPDDGDDHLAEYAPPPNHPDNDDDETDPNDETVGPYDEPWR